MRSPRSPACADRRLRPRPAGRRRRRRRRPTSASLTALAFAFLGGLILNLMPCVFPVLAMKAMALARRGRGDGARRGARRWPTRPACWRPSGPVGGALVALRRAGRRSAGASSCSRRRLVAALAWLMLAVALNCSACSRSAPRAGRWARGSPPRRACGRLLHRRAGGGGGDALHGALHGRGARRWRYHGAGDGAAVFLALGLGLRRALLLLGLRAGLARRAAAARAPGWSVLRKALAFPMYWRRGLAGLGAERSRPAPPPWPASWRPGSCCPGGLAGPGCAQRRQREGGRPLAASLAARRAGGRAALLAAVGPATARRRRAGGRAGAKAEAA